MTHPRVVEHGKRTGEEERATGALDLAPFEEAGLTNGVLEALLEEHAKRVVPVCERLWGYYANEERVRVDRRGGVVRESWQASGLPARLRGRRDGEDDRSEKTRAVIENDIAWRVDALVDMAFGKPAGVVAEGAREAGGAAEGRAALVERAVAASMEASGGEVFVRDMALLGAVHGWVDIVVRTEALFERVSAMGREELARIDDDAVEELARLVRLEVVAPTRGVALLSPRDYRVVDAYVIRTVVERPGAGSAREVVEVLSAKRRRVFVDGGVESDHANRMGVLPVVHVQHASRPYRYAGVGEVSPLVALQDELNTRLSDRAHRVTMQSFNMYLAKGLDGLSELPVGPGKVWLTDNPDASVHAFGGDGHSPSEESHIDEVREGLDKASGVSPVVLGVVRAKLGHLSSVNALRMTLLGVLTKTEQRRRTYGRGLSRCAELVLGALDVAGVLETTPAERRVSLRWPDPLPTTEEERLSAAGKKLELGVEPSEALEGLGYTVASGDGDGNENDERSA